MTADAHDVRLDVWLDVACLFKTRSEAQKACKSGRVDVNGQAGKPHRILHVGDALLIRRPLGRMQILVVRALAARHLSKSEARALYEDRTPPPPAGEIERRRADRAYRAATQAAGRPDKRDRRQLRRLKGQPD